MTDLFTPTDLASFLQRDLDTASATLAIRIAHGVMRAYTKQTLTQATTTDALRITPDDMRVYLPQHPVTAVTAVVVSGNTLAQGNGWSGYTWDGAGWHLQISLASTVLATWQLAAWPRAVVTYTHGYATPPDELVGVGLSIAARAYDNPRGLRQEAIDDYQHQYSGGTNDALAERALYPFERLLLDRYRRKTASLSTW